MAKRLSQAAKAAMKASGQEVQARARADVVKELCAIDPAFVESSTNRYLSAASFVEAKASAQSTSESSATTTLVEALAQSDAAGRADAIEALGLLKDASTLGAVRTMLADPDGEVRAVAAVALIRIGDEVLFPEVVKALRHDDPRVVVGAAVALGRLADPRVVPNLVEAFKTENPEVGAAVAWALGQCQDAGALPWLLTALEQGFATANVCEALGRVGDGRAQPALLLALQNPAADTRAYAARALGLIGNLLGKDQPSASTEPDLCQPALEALLGDKSRKVRLCAAIALFELGHQVGGPSVVQELSLA